MFVCFLLVLFFRFPIYVFAVSYGFLWFPLVSYGFLWFYTVSYGFLWFPMVSYGCLRLPAVSYGFLWFVFSVCICLPLCHVGTPIGHFRTCDGTGSVLLRCSLDMQLNVHKPRSTCLVIASRTFVLPLILVSLKLTLRSFPLDDIAYLSLLWMFLQTHTRNSGTSPRLCGSDLAASISCKPSQPLNACCRVGSFGAGRVPFF